MSCSEELFAVIVGAISAIGLIVSGFLTMYATGKAAKLAAEQTRRQIILDANVKLAEFRQAWIKDLRDTMAHYVGIAATIDRENAKSYTREMLQDAVKIELLLNPKDELYPELRKALEVFVDAVVNEKSALNSQPLMNVCQEVLKKEWEVLKKELKAADQIPSRP